MLWLSDIAQLKIIGITSNPFSRTQIPLIPSLPPKDNLVNCTKPEDKRRMAVQQFECGDFLLFQVSK